jgi:hypothetical protein
MSLEAILLAAVAVLNAVVGVLSGVVALIVTRRGHKIEVAITDNTKQINHNTEEMIRVSNEAAFARGKLEERDEQAARDAKDEEAS